MKTVITFLFLLVTFPLMASNDFDCITPCDNCVEHVKKETPKHDPPNCDNCRSAPVNKPDVPPNSDLSLKINYKNQRKYQPFTYDLLNGYGILGRIDKRSSRRLTTISFFLFEIGNCKRFYIERAEFIKSEKNKEGIMEHHIAFQIEDYNDDTTPDQSVEMEFKCRDLRVKKGDIIKVKIRSEDFPELDAPLDVIAKYEQDKYLFPPFICQGKVTSN